MHVTTFPPMRERQTKLSRLFVVSLAALAAPLLLAQDDEQIVELSPFVVTTDSDVGYLSTNSTSGTSLNTAIRDLPMTVQVLNQEFIQDQGATNLEEALAFTSGVFSSNNEASSAVGATRGSAGLGDGDSSISSAASGSRFVNNYFIRGLPTPYQNRNGFRYGGLVVTPASAIALGGLIDSSNIERIEVVKGPNSLLYGVGVLTGIVNVIPEKPLDEFRGETQVTVGSYDLLRYQADFTGPIFSNDKFGNLNWRVAGATDERGNWTDFRDEESDYLAAQLEWKASEKLKVFLEYQYGHTRINGIGSQWIFDDLGDASDTEFRNEFDERYNWARHSGVIEGLRPIYPGDQETVIPVVNGSGAALTATFGGWLLPDNSESFVGGGKSNGYRITGPDTFAERYERNYMAEVDFIPIENLTLSGGVFYSEQETEELNLNFNTQPTSFNNFTADVVLDPQFLDLYNNGQIYGWKMASATSDFLGLDLEVNRAIAGFETGDFLLASYNDDIKYTEYWWDSRIIKSSSLQGRLRAAYSFDADILDTQTSHTFLIGMSYIEDDVDFPDGSIDRGNAKENVPYLIPTNLVIGQDVLESDYLNPEFAVTNPGANDGLYYRSIANTSPIYLDGRNDNVDGHNIVRDGDLYLNQVIEQTGIYGVYHGKYFSNRLEIILGARQDTYNADQLTYKRVNISDEFLAQEAEAAGVQIPTYYRENVEDTSNGYFGIANRAGAADETFGVVPGSEFQVFEDDVQVTTGTLGVSFDLTDNFTIYGVLAEGVSPNTALRDGNGSVLPAEQTFNKEIGLKFELYDGRVSGNIAFFEIDRENAIWDIGYAPSASKYLDAEDSLVRASTWTTPTFDTATSTDYYIRASYLQEYIAEVTGIDGVEFKAYSGGGITQSIPDINRRIRDNFPDLSRTEQAALIGEIEAGAALPIEAIDDIAGRSQFAGENFNYISILPGSLDESYTVSVRNPDTLEETEIAFSSFAVLYGAFTDRGVDPERYEIVSSTASVLYDRIDAASNDGTIKNNNPDFPQSRGALVRFDEVISGFDAELFLTVTDNLQIVLNYSHIEREAEGAFAFTDWRSIVSDDPAPAIPPFTLMHREEGWTGAGITMAFVDSAAYQQAIANAGGEKVALSDLDASLVEMVEYDDPSQTIDNTIIANTEFQSQLSAGKVPVLIDRAGNILNEQNSVTATDFTSTLEGVSLNFNPEDEFAARIKYTFDETFPLLDGLDLTAGYKYSGESKTSVLFNSVSPLNAISSTPDLGERHRVDLGASYKWSTRKIDWKVALNIYDVFENTYDVFFSTLDAPDPITGEEVTKRTERFSSPTTYRISLTASF